MANSSNGSKCTSATDSHNMDHQTNKWLPKRIILLRHGQSSGNLDETIFEKVPDHKVPLTPNGIDQAKQAGLDIVKLLASSNKQGWKVFFYVSPYERTRSTLREIGRSFPKANLIGVKMECRIREQDFGNFQDHQKMADFKKERNEFSRFYYRFPQGESAADVYDRVCGFLESLWRGIEMKRFPHDPEAEELNLVIVSHGLMIRVFLMKWFRWTVEQFEHLKNLKNCEYRVLEMGAGGEYSLAFCHNDETLEKWGMSPEMIQDQKNRKLGIVDHKKEEENSKFFGLSEQDADWTLIGTPKEEAQVK